MAITYPLTFPTTKAPTVTAVELNSLVGMNSSPFTMQTQVHQYPGQRWEIDVALPPMTNSDAGEYRAFLAMLRGTYGTFLLGDHSRKTPEGLAQYDLSNQLTYSEAFDNAAWTKTESSISSDAATAPDDILSADKFIDSTNSAEHTLTRAFTTTNLETYRLSFYCKAAQHARIKIDFGTAGFAANAYAVFNLSSGTVTTTGAGLASATIATAANGFYRCTITAVADASASNTISAILVDSLGATTFVGNGTDGLYIWGAQLHTSERSVVYVKTTTTAFTAIVPLVQGASQTGNDLITDGWATHSTGILKAGDWIQLGTTSSSRMYMVVADANSDATGVATLTIVPELRSSPADNAAIVYTNCMSVFRLERNAVPIFSADANKHSRIQFKAVESL